MSTKSDHDEPAVRPTAHRNDVSRRRVLGLAAAAVAGVAAHPVDWVFALAPGGRIVKRPQAEGASGYQPVFFTADELEAVARLCDVIIPRTETPGARDARVHEYIDLVLSIEDEDEQAELRRGLEHLDRACRDAHSRPLHQATPEQLTALLTPLSEEVTAAAESDDSDDLSTGAAFFASLKGHTIFGYYTSREGRVEELGLPEAVTMERWRGCPHDDGDATHGSSERG